MCLNPLHIKNVNYGSHNPQLLILGKDTTHKYMEVPCGRCEQCVAARQSDFVQRVQAESKYNHLFFATLTYDNEHLPRLSVDVPVSVDSVRHSDESGPSLYDELLADEDKFLSLDAFDLPADDSDPVAGEALGDDVQTKTVTFAYADIHDLQLLLKNVRQNLDEYPLLAGRVLRYAAVSELGKQNGRPHFHILFFLEKRDSDCDSLGRPDHHLLRGMEQQLRQAVRKYWAVNVGTRKNPRFVPRFKYARKWSFGKMYTNFDLHWVDPALTAEQSSNVAYYISKYIMKGSDRDTRRRAFLRINLPEDEFLAVWKIIKCRMVCSKGLGLDARFYTSETNSEQVEYIPCDEYARIVDAYISNCDDLPDPADYPSNVASRRVVTLRRRVMVPNFELIETVRKNATVDLGESPGPVYIDPQGNHRPLSHYYQRFGCCYSLRDAVRIVTEYRGPERTEPTKDDADKAERRLVRRRRLIDSHAQFDNVSTVDMPDDDDTLTLYVY